MRICLVGPMSGIPDFNYPAFNKAAATLRAHGYHVENPAENTQPERPTWEGWMRLSIAKLVTCDEIALLHGWELSTGALIEARIATDVGMRVRRLEDVCTEAEREKLTDESRDNKLRTLLNGWLYSGAMTGAQLAQLRSDTETVLQNG